MQFYKNIIKNLAIVRERKLKYTQASTIKQKSTTSINNQQHSGKIPETNRLKNSQQNEDYVSKATNILKLTKLNIQTKTYIMNNNQSFSFDSHTKQSLTYEQFTLNSAKTNSYTDTSKHKKNYSNEQSQLILDSSGGARKYS